MSLIEASGIRKMFELVATMEDPVNLSIGQPDFDAPEPVKEAAIRAIRGGKNKYTVTQGIPELNEAIAAKLLERYRFRPEASLVTAGVSGGILLSFLALLNPGDEILIPDPYFVMYKHLANLCGATPKFYNLYPDFRLDPERLAALVTPRTRILFLNSPQNPTGTVLTMEELRAVAEVAKQHGLLVLSDEIYDAFVYEGKYRSICEFTDRVVLLGGFSKTFGIPGWRLGYAAGPKEIIDAMRTLQQFTYVCAPAPLQYAALAAMKMDMNPWISGYRIKRDLIYEGLKAHYRIVKPQGSFYAFPQIPEGLEEKEFIQKALAKKLLIVPGSACSERATHFRLSFAAPDKELERGVEILRSIAEKEGKGDRFTFQREK